MRVARIFLTHGGHPWVDLPLADNQGTREIIAALKLEGYLITDQWIVRDTAWSFIAILDNGVLQIKQGTGGNVTPFPPPPKPA